ncbi:multiple epidermal growth factor-like domains protein 6 [Haliotis rufescens]|uniref:multiple epidermal growth factor-like domains protein 6 n=1 Tax=Haliotis rufescens TaxID=6454 RepID=UPI00201ECEC7|nr:multiple epidermal growth factor-like domains protein 6 [Haliotis rufescens]
MALFWIIIIVCMADSTQGAGCTEGQHCSGCDTAGNCLQQCDKGYFGLKCRSPCSTTCRHNRCTLVEGRGIGKCTDGCVSGYQGISCDRPCDSQAVECTLCTGGCDGEYCQLGGACFAGCRDSFYGAGCKTCPSHCRNCSRMTGVCDECDPTHYGVNCETSCENCAGSCESSCECVPGFYGDFCAETCSKTCRPKSVHKCLPFPGMTSDNCTGGCHKHSAECLHGCVDGWFGPTCSSPCNPGCRHQRCNDAGSCAEGCEPQHFGPACEPCPESCVTCDSENGSGVGRELNCTQDCAPPICTSLPKWRHISTITLTSVVCAVVFFVLVANTVCCICFRKGPCFQRRTPRSTRYYIAIGKSQKLKQDWATRYGIRTTEIQVMPMMLQFLFERITFREPKMKALKPEMKALKPEMKALTPEMKALTPEIKFRMTLRITFREPKMKALKPEMKALKPEMKALTPEIKVLKPEMKALMPEMKALKPERKALTPEMKALTPGMQTL